MAIKNVASSIVLGLLFASLVVIYLVNPSNILVTFLSVIIMAVSLVIALTGGWREIAVMAAFAAMVSLIAANFVGRARFGAPGGIALMFLWLVVLMLLFRWISNNKLIVQGDRAILMFNTYTGGIRIVPPPLAPPPIPGVQRIAAIIPKYELSEEVRIEKINTQFGQNVDAIQVHIRYKVVDPLKTMSIAEGSGIPNRGQVQIEVAKEMGLDMHTARTDVIFWERLLDREIQLAVDDIVREVVYSKAERAVDAYKRREELAKETRERLSEMVSSWGLTITMLEFDRVDVDPERFKYAYLDSQLEREAKIKRAEAEREATRIKLLREADAAAEAERVTMLINTLKESGVDLSPADLEDIVISAIRASSEAGMDSEYMRLLMEPTRAARPTNEKRGDGGKK